MLTLYPSNRLEHLLALLNELLKQHSINPLVSQSILVESVGMQHWVSMNIAKTRGVAINLEFPMLTRFVWHICREILGHELVPYQSTYKREVLFWRIEKILKSESFGELDHHLIARYFSPSLSDELSSDQRRFRLSQLIADLYEQYMMFRPEWLLAWEDNKTIQDSVNNNISSLKDSIDNSDEDWQKWIWLRLVKQEPLHPARLQKMAIDALNKSTNFFHTPIYIFAINTMAPQALYFFDALAKHVDIHFFHLNPCVSYWGDASSNTAIAHALRTKQIENWVAEEQVNPLLANYGEQGKDLLNLLTKLDYFEISAFEDYIERKNNTLASYTAQKNQPTEDVSEELSTLQCIQQDILDGIPHAKIEASATQLNNSISIHSCHSALREVQVLHDHLLHQLSIDDQLEPSDILVICPAIEDYIPYVKAVFNVQSKRQSYRSQRAAISCSIADRAPLESEPIVAAFVQMLSLPDSRFDARAILDYLRLPAVQRKFSVDDDELAIFEHWIQSANIYWGLDAQHRSDLSGLENDSTSSSAMYSWEWGLSRLLIGMAYADHKVLADDQVYLPDVEGQAGIALGKLMQLIEQLSWHCQQMKISRTLPQWHHYFSQLNEQLFDVDSVDVGNNHDSDDSDAIRTIERVLSQLTEQATMADYQDKISVDIVRNLLTASFSSPDTSNHFMTGQVTFCSMMPMRSIPFRHIAILGLNEGIFPRQTLLSTIDLIAQQGRKQGDRSRAGDDRYLFLEAIISARQSLYLSYQGQSIQNNAIKQPSLVLQELADYLRDYYDWNISFDKDTDNNRLIRHPLHPFSLSSFAGNTPSFEAGWLRLSKLINTNTAVIDSDTETLDKNSLMEQAHLSSELGRQIDTSSKNKITQLSVDTIIQYFNDPLKFYAKQHQVYLEPIASINATVEPFIETALDKYKAIDLVTRHLLLNVSPQSTSHMSVDEIKEYMRKTIMNSGDVPNTPVAERHLQEWSEISELLAETVREYGPLEPSFCNIQLEEISVSAISDVDGDGNRILYHPGKLSFKHKFNAWLRHLIGEVCQTILIQDTSAESATTPIQMQANTVLIGIKQVTRQGQIVLLADKFDIVTLGPELAYQYLSNIIHAFNNGINSPQLLHNHIADDLVDKKNPLLTSENEDENQQLRKHQQRKWVSILEGGFFKVGLIDDPYFNIYFQTLPALDDALINQLTAVYQPFLVHCLSKKNTGVADE